MKYKERVSDLHKNLVVSYDEGERLGHVSNVYFDRQTCRIKGISLSSKSPETDNERFISFENIHKLGKSVVIVAKKAALEALPEGLDSSSLRYLKRTKVVTQDGEHLGELQDVNVIAKSGIIHEIILFGNRKVQIEVETDNLSIGPDMIVVPAAYKSNITEIADPEDRNELGKFIVSAGNKVANSIKLAVQKVTEPSQPHPDTGPEDSMKGKSDGSSIKTELSKPKMEESNGSSTATELPKPKKEERETRVKAKSPTRKRPAKAPAKA
ncbi:MAG: PRC-barrel domain-containing protein, partial [Pseudohongiellaceae bacterium]